MQLVCELLTQILIYSFVFSTQKIKSKKETSEALFKINTRNRLIPVLRGQDHEVTPKYQFPYGKLKSKI